MGIRKAAGITHKIEIGGRNLVVYGENGSGSL